MNIFTFNQHSYRQTNIKFPALANALTLCVIYYPSRFKRKST